MAALQSFEIDFKTFPSSNKKFHVASSIYWSYFSESRLAVLYNEPPKLTDLHSSTQFQKHFNHNMPSKRLGGELIKVGIKVLFFPLPLCFHGMIMYAVNYIVFKNFYQKWLTGRLMIKWYLNPSCKTKSRAIQNKLVHTNLFLLFFPLMFPIWCRGANTTKPNQRVISLSSLSLGFWKQQHAIVWSQLVNMLWWCILWFLKTSSISWGCFRFVLCWTIPPPFCFEELLYMILSLYLVELAITITIQQCLLNMLVIIASRLMWMFSLLYLTEIKLVNYFPDTIGFRTNEEWVE